MKKTLGYINLIADGLHNFIDSSLIASTLLIDFQLGLVTTVAIIIHEIPQEIADFTILVHSDFAKTWALLWNLIFVLTAVLGGWATYLFANLIESVTPILLGVAAGSFLHLAMSDIIPELQPEKKPEKFIASWPGLSLGILLVYFSNQPFGSHTHA